jgi:hypothetical protein
MGFLDKAKAAATQAATKAKEGVEDVQAKLDLGNAYNALGKATFELIESGAVSHPDLEEPAAKVRELKERLEGDKDKGEEGEEGDEGEEGEEPAEAETPEAEADAGAEPGQPAA